MSAVLICGSVGLRPDVMGGRGFASTTLLFGVGRPVKPVSDMRGTDARSRERNRPDPVSQGFQVSLYKVDPRVCIFARNLLSNDFWRAALLNEVEECGP